jgi:uncharacterized protein with von Willebrand factor type A (vWA) domain
MLEMNKRTNERQKKNKEKESEKTKKNGIEKTREKKESGKTKMVERGSTSPGRPAEVTTTGFKRVSSASTAKNVCSELIFAKLELGNCEFSIFNNYLVIPIR